MPSRKVPSSMSPRERWISVLQGSIPDRVPMDYAGTPELTQKLMKFLNVSSQEDLNKRLHIDAPYQVGPLYKGPPIPDGEDMYGCRFLDVDYGSGVYQECVYHPLAQYSTIEEVEAHYRWPSADWYDYSVIPGQLFVNQGSSALMERPTMLGLAGIYTLYTWLRGLELAFTDFAIHHEMVLYCMDKLVAFHSEKAIRSFEMAKGRIDIASIANDMGTQIDLLFSLSTIRKLFLPGIRHLADLAHQNGAAVYLHSDGAIRKAIPDLIDAGVNILDPVQWRCKGMDRSELKQEYGDKLVFHGAVDNQYTLFLGSVADVKAEVEYNIDILGKDGGYILAPCHALQAVNPPENVVAMYDAGYEYGVY
jgi:uroporphyrinogen decarboxylase